MRRWIGRWLMVVGVVHTVAAVAFFGASLRAIAGAGLWNTLGRDPVRNLAFWFLVTGFVLALLGAVVDWIEVREGGVLPAFIGWGLLSITVLGIVALPVSGFWLLLPPAMASIGRAAAVRGRRVAPAA